MCNIAAYIGTRPAAPILMEMMRRQEGWDGGFYSGIATIHEGCLHHAKCIGAMEQLTGTTDAADLPGTVGFIHSRSFSGGGDREWAHPFIGTGGKTAFIANGVFGCFLPDGENRNRMAAENAAAGYPCRARAYPPIGNYPRTADGGCVHASDLVCQTVTRNMDGGLDAAAAMEKAFCTMPLEFVGLLLAECEPDSVTWARINMPMMVAFAPHGAYMGTTAMAFPEDAGEPVLLPALSRGRVFADRFTADPFAHPPATVSAITPRLRHDAFEIVCRELEGGERTIGYLRNAIEPLFEPADCHPRAAVVYPILHQLQKEGRLKIAVHQRPGVLEGLSAPWFKAYLYKIYEKKP